ncbi:MAG: YkgJ family cysteine cluster protein [Methanobacteriaceae archaeon]|nr:YkgJ family cysteine cluster protein [Methanobacteriaceae archaeon]
MRDHLIDGELFENIRKMALKEEWDENKEGNVERFENTVLQRMRKKRQVKSYKKLKIKKSDLKEIIQLADITSLELFQGPSNLELAQLHTEWCNHCGKCCTQSSPIFIHRDEIRAITTLNSSLKDEIIPNQLYPEHFQFKEDRPCKFHDPEQKRCKIYQTRPQVCQNYPLMLIGSEGKEHHIINLRHNCHYATRLVLEKAIILFDEAVKRKSDVHNGYRK